MSSTTQACVIRLFFIFKRHQTQVLTTLKPQFLESLTQRVKCEDSENVVFWLWACFLQQDFALDVTNRVEVPELTARFQMVGGIVCQISSCLCQRCCHSRWVETSVANKREKPFQDNRQISADSYSFTESNIFKLRDQKLYNRNHETHRVMVENSQLEGPVFSSGIKTLYFSCGVTVEKGVRTG